ncbi:CBS domain-containing protein [Brevibacillus humidisoli]|uniref:CBS domain-containing protein n=1 Tax=Brevibacillus humidisoli TaxID=2895522 RepID=UPI001E55C4A5|nr:CBS domain-containing protein [Brevibacillus humidisoli]UFJ42941.1 CBS domain-containing protein [Brevibacillus humidisoli]
MKAKQLWSIPVVADDGSFYGALSKRSLFELFEKGLFRGSYEEFIQLPLAEGVDRRVPALTEQHLFEDALPIIVRYPFVPVVDEANHFLGILKRKDVELELESAFGMNIAATRMVIAQYERKGILQEIMSTLVKHDANVVSCISFDSKHHGVRRILTKYKSTESGERIKQDLEQRGFVVTSLLDNH